MHTIFIRLPRPLIIGCTVMLSLCLMAFVRMTAANDNSSPALSPSLFGKAIVIDAGHGGWDPGMSGASGSAEADINLEISLKLARYCRESGATVIMTRESDIALADSKAEDMAARTALTDNTDMFISIHCNSYPGQRGAQVFYERGNEQGQLLAESIQEAVKTQLANTQRQAMAHADSYLLKNIAGAAVICETGFLSHPEEESLLNDEGYQWDMAWAIFSGMVDYLIAAAE